MDDYIIKPIDIAVTRAKIQAVLRRLMITVDSEKITYGELTLNRALLEGKGRHS